MVSTTNFGFYQPLVNSSTDADLWGGELNTGLSEIDGVLFTAMNLTPSSQTSTITVTAPTSGSTTTGSSNTLYLCNATGGAFAANLPAVATASGMRVVFKKTDSSANAITITGHSSDTIDGSNTFSLSAQYQYVVLVCDGTNWDIISQTAPATVTPLVRNAVFTSTGSNTWTTPSNINSSTIFKVTLTGAGGGSGGVANGSSSGGGAGSTAIYYASGLSASTGYTITIGVGGVAGSNSPGNGGNGGNSTAVFGATTVTAPGGNGSTATSGGGCNGGFAGGGACTNATISLPGGGSTAGMYQGNAIGSGAGGASYWGGGGASISSGSGSGQAGQAPGSGASGSFSSSTIAGAAGANGICTIEWIA